MLEAVATSMAEVCPTIDIGLYNLAHLTLCLRDAAPRVEPISEPTLDNRCLVGFISKTKDLKSGQCQIER